LIIDKTEKGTLIEINADTFAYMYADGSTLEIQQYYKGEVNHVLLTSETVLRFGMKIDDKMGL